MITRINFHVSPAKSVRLRIFLKPAGMTVFLYTNKVYKVFTFTKLYYGRTNVVNNFQKST